MKMATMRSLLPAVGIMAVMALGSIVFDLVPARAGTNYAFCLDRGGDTQCDYATYEQCQATASGIGADCIANPDTRGIQTSEPARPPRRTRRRR
jgi:uncharacterized protein DUF3551